MLQINNLTGDAQQITTVTLADGSAVQINLNFRGATGRWTIDVLHPSIPAGGAIYGINLTVHPNLLRQYRNVIPFGLACTSSDGADPFQINDFINGRITLYILDNSGGATDVDDVETNVYNALT